jgi:NADPH:quinone reductase-like Zn-dependent oxidoreductase
MKPDDAAQQAKRCAVSGCAQEVDFASACGVDAVGLMTGFSLITESVGGESLARAIECVAPGGTIVMFGSSSGELTPIGFRQLVPRYEGARLQGHERVEWDQ